MITPLLHEIATALHERDAQLAVAESCTGGMLAQNLTSIPGSSDWFLGGIISYANRIKTDFLGVPEELLEEQGAVSKEVAEVMALSVRARFDADYSIPLTGIAGPGGGTV